MDEWQFYYYMTLYLTGGNYALDNYYLDQDLNKIW